MASAVAASAPGKVLLTGGYLVLERPFAGLVAAVDARFYAVVGPLLPPDTSSGDESLKKSESERTVPIAVRSPQFRTLARYWLTYRASEQRQHHQQQLRQDGSTAMTQLVVPLLEAELVPDNGLRKHPAGLQRGESLAERENPFTERAILWSLVCASGVAPGSEFYSALERGLDVLVAGDNSFYGQRSQLNSRGHASTRANLTELPPFLPLALSSGSLQKTGLGSSAALTTALVAAVMRYVGAAELPTPGSRSEFASDSRRFVHNVSQLSHCLAQGKIGSGFDVSSACFGSHRYVRFPKEDLDPWMDKLTKMQSSASLVSSSSNAPWRHIFAGPLDVEQLLHAMGPSSPWGNAEELIPFQLPRGFRLLMGDVDKGSNTPNMVAKVLQWWRGSEARPLIDELNMCNERVSGLIAEIAGLPRVLGETRYDSQLQAWVSGNVDAEGEATNVADMLAELRASYGRVRFLLRSIGTNAGVGIEPPDQTALIDRTVELPGVLIAGVPGAGGHDAIFAIIAGSAGSVSDTQKLVEQVWEQLSVLPLALAEDQEGLLAADASQIIRSANAAVDDAAKL